jgi:hypothetical protein
MVNTHSPAFQQVTSHLAHFSQQVAGGTPATAALRANALVSSNVVQQAFVRAINDDFLIAGGITALTLIPLFILRTHKQKSARIAPMK